MARGEKDDTLVCVSQVGDGNWGTSSEILILYTCLLHTYLLILCLISCEGVRIGNATK